MSIHVTVSGNPVNIRRGRMVLSDLDQIKKNERDRRRRLRLEQVRQQSKEISNRLLERAKKIAKEELSKLEKDGKSELKQMHDRKIMEIQQKYQEDLEDIGQAHASAALQPDADAIIEEERRKDRAVALKRGKDAAECIREAKQKEDNAEAAHQERLRKVREMENMRAALIAKLPKPTSPQKNKTVINSSQEDTSEEVIHEALTPERKSKKVLSKKSPRRSKKSKEHEKTLSLKPGPSGLQKQVAVQPPKLTSKKKTDKADQIERIVDSRIDEQLLQRTVPVISTAPTKTDKVTRYNPEDFTQDMSDNTSSISSSSSSSISDDSSYFSDAAEQIASKKPLRTTLTDSKVQLYDHNLRQRNVYNTPLGIVERIDIGNEPNAIEAAQTLKNTENIKTHIFKTRKLNAQRRGDDAMLRERVRRDYQAFIKNLDHLAREERKLKASQIESNVEEDTHMRLHQRKKCQEERQKRLNRAVKKVFDTHGTPPQYSHLTERVITLPTQRKGDAYYDVPHSTWQDHLAEEEADICHTERDKDSEMSREEEILDMLKKVERQKRLLLQEFGASLPDDIFNASMKPLFKDGKPVQVADTAKPLSPEIKVINMSGSDESVKKVCKTKKRSKSPTKKIEIAVQAALDKTGPAENKGVQVELPEESTVAPLSTRDTTSQIPPHPLEPKITIITPETDDSSNDSTSSEISGMVIEIDKREVIVTPKRRASSVRISKRPSPRIYQKIRTKSVSSKATSPMKRFSRSQSSSRLTSPQKRTKCTDAPDTASRRVDIHVSRSAFNDDTDPSQETRVSIDASAESSQTYSGVNDQDGAVGKPYRVRTQMKRWIRIKDTSDTSTSFASPPPLKPKSMLDALTNVTPILEMLDASGPEELRRLRQDISPVSTPETPSPRTMMMPSNIPHRDRISRILRYNSNDSQNNNNAIFSSTRQDQSTLTEPSDTCRQASEYRPTSSRRPSVSSKVCICKNPTCKLLHMKLDDIHDYALKNCPEMLQKYDDLQNLCTERIASLTDLIEKVRTEQKGMDFSLIAPSDETSLMQLSTRSQNDVETVRRLIESIEAVHAQLAKTLLESQRIIGREAIPEDGSSRDAEVQVTTSTPRSKLIDTVTAHIQKSEVVEGKAKPKIISDERVNIQLNRFKIQQKPQATPATRTSERNSWPPCTLPLREEEIIEKLSKEILEQSKSLNKASSAFVPLKGTSEISVQHKTPSFKDSMKNNVSEKDNKITKEITSNQETTKENDFIPILTGIPKSRNYGTVTLIGARPKPPVTLLNGPYRPELESSGHELSTIVEFDTTDTVNKNVKSPTKSKPSVHVAPLPVQNQSSLQKLADPISGMKSSDEKFSAQRSQETTTICSSPEKLKDMADCTSGTKTEAERECTVEKYNKQLQCTTTIEEPISQAKDKLDSSMSTDLNNLHKDSKYKTTSTSLYSFSGLSGISTITSSPSSDVLKNASSPEEMETALKKLGLGWAVTTLKKTREASALSSSSNSDVTPVNTARRMISPTKKHHDPSALPEISDVSSISIKEASKSTEQAVLLKGRTSTPKFQNSNSNSERSSTTQTSGSIQDPSDSLTVPNVSLTKTKSDNKLLQSP